MRKVVRKLGTYYRLLGWRGALVAALAKLLRRPLDAPVQPRGFSQPFTIRMRTADVPVFRQVFEEQQYLLPLPTPPTHIIDAGANIGLASLFFTRQYPAAHILALEPEAGNYARLCRNVSPYPNITPINAALWSEVTTLDLLDPGIGAWGFQVARRAARKRQGAGYGRIQGVTIASLLAQYGWEMVDLLKLDIEGSEKPVLDASADWIERVGLICAELHDWITPGSQQSFLNATHTFPYLYQRGEKSIASRTLLAW